MGVTETSEITTEDSEEDATNEQTLMMKVPYAGKKSEGLIRGLKTCLQHNLPDNIKCRIVQTGTKISKKKARRRILRTKARAGKDKESWIFKHSSQSKHPKAKNENFEILATGYANRRKVEMKTLV